MKGLIIACCIMTIIIAPILIVVADISLTVSALSNTEDLDAKLQDYSFQNVNNEKLNYNVSLLIATPQAGFIPKGLIITIVVKSGETLLQEITKDIDLGKNETILIQGDITGDDIKTLLQGGTFELTLSGSVKARVLGFEVPGVNIGIPGVTISSNDFV